MIYFNIHWTFRTQQLKPSQNIIFLKSSYFICICEPPYNGHFGTQIFGVIFGSIFIENFLLKRKDVWSHVLIMETSVHREHTYLLAILDQCVRNVVLMVPIVVISINSNVSEYNQ